MVRIKSETLTIRINPTVKEALRKLAEEERRSVGNLIEVMVLERQDRSGKKTSKTASGKK